MFTDLIFELVDVNPVLAAEADEAGGQEFVQFFHLGPRQAIY